MNKNKYGLKWINAKTKGVRPQLAFYALLALCIPIIQLLFAYFMKLFIDIATGDLSIPLMQVGIHTIGIVAVGGILIMINSVLSKWIYGKMECNIRAELCEVIFSRRMIDISKQHTGELLTKLTADIQAVSMCFKLVIENVVAGTVSVILATAALFFLNWKIAIILLVLIPLLMFLMGIMTPQIQKAAVSDKANDEANRSLIQEDLSRIILVKTYFMQSKIISKMNSLYETKLKSGMNLGKWEGLAVFAGILFGNIMSLITLGVGSYFVIKGETTVGSLIMIVQLLNYIVNPITKLTEAIAQISQATASAERIGSVYELPADQAVPSAMLANAEKLMVKDLSFSYNENEVLLNGIDMFLTKGEVVGIVGKSGSGKSTLLRLLIGLYAPKHGVVELKSDSDTFTGLEIMPHVAYVPPNDYLFSGNITDNIIMAEGDVRYEEMKLAASAANVLEFIESLPEGFNTQIGESGSTLSSGQAQRIAIARAIYKKAHIIVFDEPSANLDVDTIEKFQVLVKHLADDKICVIVTHDESVITSCDRVYVLDQGSVRQRLSSEELKINAVETTT